MDKTDEIYGAEGIVIHNNNVVLGMQKPKRWYPFNNGQKAAIIKTLGGKVEEEDEGNTKNAFIREVLEEVNGITNYRVSKQPIFTKKITMGELNPYERSSTLNLNADFYVLEIFSENGIKPNDLPALIEIPIDKFMDLNLCVNMSTSAIKEYIIKNGDIDLPENYAIMAPNEVKNFFRMREDKENAGEGR